MRSKHLVPAMQGLANAYAGLGRKEESLKVLIRAYQIASVTPDVLEKQDAEALAAQNGALAFPRAQRAADRPLTTKWREGIRMPPPR